MSGTIVGFYKFTNVIGSGAFGSVWECEHMKTKETFACKIIDLKLCMDGDALPHFRNELLIHSKIRHPCITQLRDVILDDNKIYVFLELCQGGALSKIVEAENGLSESKARVYFSQIMSALAYVHDLNVAHRDIKLDNILVTSENHAKLSDFGLSRQASETSEMKTTCGTLLYAAPEIIQELPYNGMKVDIWSAGVVLYTMIANHFPWSTPDDLPVEFLMQETARQITSGDFDMPDEVSFELQNLLCNMLEQDPEARPTAAEILEHPWFEGEEGDTIGLNTEPDQALVEKVEAVLKMLDVKCAEFGRKVN